MSDETKDLLDSVPAEERTRIVALAEKARGENHRPATAPWAGQAAYDATVKREVAAYHARPEIGKAPTAPWQPPTCDAGHVTRAGEACSTCAPDAATDVETTVERRAQEAKARHAAICDRLGPMSSAVWDYVVRPMATENAALRIQLQNERSSPVWAILGEAQAALGLPRGALLGEVVAAARNLTAGRRKAAQTLIAEIGASGPENIEETAERAATEIRRLNGELAKLGALKSAEIAPVIERFREAFGADVPQAPSGKRAESLWTVDKAFDVAKHWQAQADAANKKLADLESQHAEQFAALREELADVRAQRDAARGGDAFTVEVIGADLAARAESAAAVYEETERLMGVTGDEMIQWKHVVQDVDASRPTFTLDREALGRLVREVWIAWAREQPSPKASWLVPWEGLSEPDREVDRRIGERIVREALARRPAATERAFPRVALDSVAPGSLIEIASGEIGIVLKPNRETATGLRSIAWVRRWNGLVSELSAGATVSLRATPTELGTLTSADGSQPAEDPLAIPLSRYADGLEQVAAQGGCSVATADKLLRAVVAIRCAISGEPLSRAADASQAEVVAMRAALTAVGFPPRPNESLMRTFECAWTWCVGLAHKAQDASRPTLTEEQARGGWFLAAAWARLAQARGGAMQAFDEDYEKTKNARGWLESIGVDVNANPPVVIPEALRASRGETGEPAKAPPVRHPHHDRHCMIYDGVGCSHEAGCEVEK